ncbi:MULTISPECIES: WhiB family transcriptional regulator [unclassified Streptomyces]|uniref:WhiB family transcriptional regulator n=1 Tax=unclassified Streptomyces TaxID=2593676 RepID=UPI0011610A03|nr:WhiB family transcriptional regulator [Streptomyces sp. CB02366]
MTSAVCATATDPDMWFSSGGTRTKAVQLCQTCPVRSHCEEYARALEAGAGVHSRHGVWGGTGAQRRVKDRPEVQPRNADRTAVIRQLIERGMPPAEIAAHVGVTVRTVYRVKRASQKEVAA